MGSQHQHGLLGSARGLRDGSKVALHILAHRMRTVPGFRPGRPVPELNVAGAAWPEEKVAEGVGV